MIPKRKSLLVVDDDRNIRSMMETVARRCDAAITMAKDGQEALQILGNGNSFDAIFLDLMMPGICGWEVLDSIRRKAETIDTPVCLFSGVTVTRKEKQALCDDQTHFIHKGAFSLLHFISFIEGLLSTEPTSGQRDAVASRA
jgi:CheY-like chemotaxis protein